MTAPERADETAYFAGKGSSETFDYRQISEQIASMPAPTGVPLHMLVCTSKQCDSPDDICGRTYPAYLEITKALSEDWPQGAVHTSRIGTRAVPDQLRRRGRRDQLRPRALTRLPAVPTAGTPQNAKRAEARSTQRIRRRRDAVSHQGVSTLDLACDAREVRLG